MSSQAVPVVLGKLNVEIATFVNPSRKGCLLLVSVVSLAPNERVVEHIKSTPPGTD